LGFDKATDSLKVGTFLRQSVHFRSNCNIAVLICYDIAGQILSLPYYFITAEVQQLLFQLLFNWLLLRIQGWAGCLKKRAFTDMPAALHYPQNLIESSPFLEELLLYLHDTLHLCASTVTD